MCAAAVVIALLSWLVVAPALAQSANDGFDPAPNNRVDVSAVQPDGKILIAGLFNTVSGTNRVGLARLNVDGSVDASFFAPQIFGGLAPIRAIVVQDDGRIILGGFFKTPAPFVRTNLVRLHADGSMDTNFVADADNTVESLLLLPDGKLLVGGFFKTVNRMPPDALSRLHPDGSVDTNFTTRANYGVLAMVRQPDGRILLSGQFTLLGGVPRNNVGRLNADGSVDAAFNPGAIFNPSQNDGIDLLALQPDGRWFAGGFMLIGNTPPRRGLLRFHPDGSLDESIPQLTNQLVRSIALEADGKLLIGGSFNQINGQPRTNLARLLPDGSLDASFAPVANGGSGNGIMTLAVQSDGKILVGGGFANLAGTARTNLARLYAHGSVDATLNLGTADANHWTNDFPSSIYAAALTASGKCIVGGDFTSLAGHPREKFAQFKADGTMDTNFHASGGMSPLDTVNCLAALPDGKFLAGGGFNFLNGQVRQWLGRLNSDGTLDSSFTNRIGGLSPPGPQGVDCMAVQADGMVVLGGIFNSVDGLQRKRLARLTVEGSLDPVFDPAPNGREICIASQPDGKLLVGGDFSMIGGLSRSNLVRLNWDGTVDTNFNPVVGLDPFARGGGILCIAIQADGKILVGGWFESINSVPRSNLARLNPDGSLDGSFDVEMIGAVVTMVVRTDGSILLNGGYASVGAGFQPAIWRITAGGVLDDTFDLAAYPSSSGIIVQQDGKIVVVGSMTNVAGEIRPLIGRVSIPEAASEKLSVDFQARDVTWMRSGSSPEVWNVSMGWSMDGTNYADLGNAVRISGGWRLGDLSIPTGQNFYIRTTGRTISGHRNASSGVIESVAQFWRLPPPFLNNVQVIGVGQFQFSFTNTNATAFFVLASTNATAPLVQWESLDAPLPVGDGLYQFTDPGATNHARRFYQLRSP